MESDCPIADAEYEKFLERRSKQKDFTEVEGSTFTCEVYEIGNETFGFESIIIVGEEGKGETIVELNGRAGENSTKSKTSENLREARGGEKRSLSELSSDEGEIEYSNKLTRFV